MQQDILSADAELTRAPKIGDYPERCGGNATWRADVRWPARRLPYQRSTDAVLWGHDSRRRQANTIIRSGVVGRSLFTNAASFAGFLCMTGMQRIGIGIGVMEARGNGLAINLLDPAIRSGAYTPAPSIVRGPVYLQLPW